MKTRIFHGTSAECEESIRKEGFREKGTLWHCSDPEIVYFYDQAKFEEDEDPLNLAFDSACVSAALLDSPSSQVRVIEIEIDDRYLSPDSSWEYANLSVQINRYELNVLLRQGLAKVVKLHSFKYNSLYRVFYLSRLADNPLSEIDYFISYDELGSIRAVKDVFVESVYDRIPDGVEWFEEE